jgi:hypothetical protein
MSSSSRQPGGHGLCNIGGATNGGSSGGGGGVGGAGTSERSLFATVLQRISKLVAVAVKTSSIGGNKYIKDYGSNYASRLLLVVLA